MEDTEEMTYAVTVTESIVAKHFLTVPDPGPEGKTHSHTYEIEATFRGDAIDEHGYLLDIDEATGALSAIADHYRGALLNELLEGNPSCERLAAAIHSDLQGITTDTPVSDLSIRIGEDDTAKVTYRSSV